jgi:phytoene dehydrogenase-like protein
MTLVLDWKKIDAYAENMGPGKDYPTVIIGAGLGGLICGAYLVKQGIPVTVVEQHDIPGGYTTAFSREKGKFNFEVALHGTSIHNNSASRLLKELGVLDKLELVALPEVYRLKTPKLDISVHQKDPEAYIKMLAGHFPSEADGIQGFISYMIGLADETDKISRNKGKFVRALFPLQFPKMWNVRNKTLSDLLSNYIEDNELKSDKTTFMPSIIHRSTRLRPMSLAAPVITATLFLNSFI